ncbi:hypothetical protein TWF569_002562 [Orbilia oligospora]|uniref:Uncharacterized protein n=1 Tax=Orbilia oligospora TaxID=2813651 RepID=A0A7C8NF66_ORBOL|nr:hypothetical protein TWF706_009697 [Orbilia oligospora]KAF3102704.1 hypothetical protein TWF102_004376 [Orbilia oligospora]KAF3110442.1 hypothetical protein TWF103_004712 [Orbilia oligospora]KAF3121513.1 hypothetical protein TWF569_002562 [Orbilia oligospora]KAF3123335.1 hypothetical protein TWF594_002453 [Orbilia oligospora]
MASERVDVVVVGAGWYGLCASKTYLQINPETNLVVLEEASSAGGVWAKHRLYPGLKSNNQYGLYDPNIGTYEYPDFPMKPFGVTPGTHIPGETIHEYLNAYAKKFNVYDKIRFDSKLSSAEYLAESSQWLLTIGGQGGVTKTLLTDKLIMATGVTSEPFLPLLAGQENFGRPLFHAKDLLQHSDELLKSSKNVTVFGGSKSAWDAVYLFASNGIKVNWVVRAKGTGFCWMSPPKVTPAKKWIEKLITTRFLTWFSPCIWDEADGYSGVRNFMHGTALGRGIVDTFFGILGSDVQALNGYDNHPETKKMKPLTQAFFIASTLSILNYPTDIFEYVRDGTVTIHLKDIEELSPGKIHLSDPEKPEENTVIETDALICSTGWKYKPHVKFLPEGIERDLGLPYVNKEIPDYADEELVKKADAEILKKYPRLANQPTINANYEALRGGSEHDELNRPFRLWRLIAPPTKKFHNSIVFCGALMNLDTSITAHIQSLWATAYLTNKLKPVEEKSEEDINWEATLWSRFGRWRTSGGFGRRYPDFVFDSVAYFSHLLKDLDVEPLRKTGLFSQVFYPYGPEDYVTVVDEWQEKHKA